MIRLLESRGFWFRLAGVLCLAFGVMVQVLDHVREEPAALDRPQPTKAYAPSSGPPPSDQG
jgi:hypothetical protein